MIDGFGVSLYNYDVKVHNDVYDDFTLNNKASKIDFHI